MEKTRLLDPTPDGLAAASDLLAAGWLVAFPTETVYGLGGDARHADAVAGIYAAKGRPSFNPLIVHVADMAHAERIAVFDGRARELAAAFWPGPFTLVLPLRDGHGIASLVTAGLDTVALRVPAHPLARALLHRFGGPLAAPSANPSGAISPTTAAHVTAGLGGRIAAVIDGGACAVGLESTILGGDPLTLLRPGGVPTADIEALTGPLASAGPQITAPGQLVSHYAPGASVRLDATTARRGEVLLGFGPMPCDLNLSETGDLTEAATRLFDALHVLDATGHPIAVAPIPDTGLGAAINDRLRRAAAPR
ncbi:MAG: L-threonylcarbamoyladenylate synthase [Pseudomonadota bacterium]